MYFVEGEFRFSAIFHKRDTFYDFLFAFLYTDALLKRGYSKRKTIAEGKHFFFQNGPFQKRAKLILTELSPLTVYYLP